MEGIDGLRLISTTLDTISISQIVITKGVCFFFLLVSIVVCIALIKKSSTLEKNYLPGLILIFISLLINYTVIKGLIKYKIDYVDGNTDKIHKFEIVKENYYVDLSKYTIIEITDNTITLLEEKK